MSTVSCPKCHYESPFGSTFCGNCAFSLVPISGSSTCTACGTNLPPKAKFCGHCAAPVPTTTGMSGSVRDGEWVRGDGEFVKKVNPEDMQSNWGGKAVKVPAGTICAVVKDGVVDTIHKSGHKVAVGMMENFFGWLKGGIDASFYLIDCSPIPFATNVVRTSGSRQQHISVRIQALLVQANDQGGRLNRFINTVVGEKDAVTTQDVYTLMHSQVVQSVKGVLARAGDDFLTAEKRIVKELNQDLGSLYGLHFTASVEVGASLYTVNVQLGQNEVPKMAKCVKCNAQVPYTAMFCGMCATRQPVRKGESGQGEVMPLITSDNRQLELDLVFQLQGTGDFGQNDSLIPAIASAASGAVRAMTADQAISADGLRRIQDEIADKLTRQITGFQLKQVVVLDVKDKNGQWLLNARADVQRQRDQLELNKEWMGLESEEMELEKMALDMVLARQSMQLDQEFERLQLEQADQLRRLENAQAYERQTTDLNFGHERHMQATTLEHERQTTEQNFGHERHMQEATLSHGLAMDERELKDEEARVALDDARADIDIHNTNRSVNTNIAKDEAGRRLDRHMDEQDHVDNRVQYGREREILEQERADLMSDDRVEMQHSQDMENLQVEHEMLNENRRLEHELANENRRFEHELNNERETVKQNIWIKDQQVDSTVRTNEKMAESDNRIHLNNAKTEDQIDWMRAQTADKTRRMDIETNIFAEKSVKDLAFEDDARRNAMNEANKDAEERRDMERLKAQAEIAANLSAQKKAHELAMDAQQSQHAQAMKKMDVDVETARINADRDVAMNEDRIRSAVDSNARDEAERRAEMERQFRLEADARADKHQAQLDARVDKQTDMMMAMMQQLTQGLAGTNQAKQQADQQHQQAMQQQQQATINAHKDAAAQARDMANASMNSMSNVAASAAGNRPGYPQGQQVPPTQQAAPSSQPQASANRGPMGFHNPSDVAAQRTSEDPKAEQSKYCPYCEATYPAKLCTTCGYPVHRQ